MELQLSQRNSELIAGRLFLLTESSHPNPLTGGTTKICTHNFFHEIFHIYFAPVFNAVSVTQGRRVNRPIDVAASPFSLTKAFTIVFRAYFVMPGSFSRVYVVYTICIT